MTKVTVGGGSSVHLRGTIKPGLEDVIEGTNVTIDKTDPKNPIISSTGGGGSMVYPGAGIALSTGSAWGASITNNSSNWNTAYGWGNHASAGYLTSLTNGNGTTVNGTGDGVDLGGTTTGNFNVTGIYDQQFERSEPFVVSGPGWNAIDLTRYKLQSGGFKIDASLSNDGGAFGTRTAKLELVNDLNVSSTSAYYQWLMNSVDPVTGRTTSFELDPYYFRLKGGSAAHSFLNFDFGNSIFSFKRESDNNGFYFTNSGVWFGESSFVNAKFGYDATGSVINLGSDATGDIYRRNSSGYFSRLALGTALQTLRVNAGGTDIEWAAPSGGSGLTVGTSTITSGTNTRVLYNNSGVLGEYTVSGSGNVALTNSPVFTTPNIGTATGTASGNLLLAGGTYTTTTGNGLALTSSTLTSGNLVSLTNTGTAAASNTKTVLNVASSGANGTSTQTTYGAQFANTNTGTSSTNIGASFSASGGTNNYAAYIAAGELKFAGGGTIANTSGNLTISSDVNFSSGLVFISGGRSILFNGGDGLIASNSNSQIAFRSNQTTSTKIPFRFYNVGGSYSATSGTQTIIGNEASFAPTSGTAVFNAYLGSGTFNQTGGANGLVTMMHLAPTITAASSLTGFRYAPVSGSATTELAFHATQGSLVMGGATISTSGIFGWNNTTKELKVNGMRIWTDHDTNGKDNTFVGYNSGNLSVSGIDNVGVGPGTLLAVTTGSDNVAFGNLAGALIQDGTGNILAGQFAGGSLVSGNGNIMQGTHAGYVATGSNNIIIGQNAGDALTTGSNNLIIGVDIDPQSNTADNQMTIQNAIFGSGNNGSGTSLSGGNIGFYATTWGTSAAHVISIGNGTAPSTSIVDGVQLYAEDVSSSSELKVRDEAGNVTTLSPHNFSLIEKSEAGAWSHYSEYTNPKTGEREAVNVDMLKLARLIEQLTGDKLVYKTTLKK